MAAVTTPPAAISSPIPVASGEHFYGRWEVERYLEATSPLNRRLYERHGFVADWVEAARLVGTFARGAGGESQRLVGQADGDERTARALRRVR